MPPKFNVNAREFTPTPTPSPSPAPKPRPLPHEDEPFPSIYARRKIRHQRRDRSGRSIKYLATGLQPPPRRREPRRDPVDIPRKYQAACEDPHEYLQQEIAKAQIQEEEQARAPPPAPTPTAHSAATHYNNLDAWQRRLHQQHPRAWTSVSGIGLGADWGKAVGEGYDGLRYTGPRPITGEEMSLDYVVERAYEEEEWIPQ